MPPPLGGIGSSVTVKQYTKSLSGPRSDLIGYVELTERLEDLKTTEMLAVNWNRCNNESHKYSGLLAKFRIGSDCRV